MKYTVLHNFLRFASLQLTIAPLLSAIKDKG